MSEALLSELIKRAARENSALVEPVGRTDSPSQGPGKFTDALYFGGLGADVATTAVAMNKGLTEANPLLKWAGPKMAAPLAGMGGIATYLLAKKLLGKKHPKLLKGLLMGLGGAHGTAAVSNIHQMGKQPSATPPMAGSAPRPNMVQGADGSWYDPNFITPQ